MTYIEGQREDGLLLPFTVMVTNELHDSINLIVQKVERKLAHFRTKDVDIVKVLSQDSPGRSSFVRAIYKRQPFLLSNCVAELNPI